MRKLLGILGVLWSFTLMGQVLELKVNLESKGNSSEYLYSEKYEIGPTAEASFTGINTYILKENVECNLAYRIKSSGVWQGWKSMSLFEEGETPGRSVYEGNPVFDHLDSMQFRGSVQATGLWHFRIYRAFGSSEMWDIKEGVSNIPCPQPSYCDRMCWCDTCPKDNTPTPTIPTHLIIHHSAGFSTAPDYKQVMGYYWDFHVNTNGWDDIGYNWLIDPNGVIYEGRGSNTLGAHFSCMNNNTLGICMIGNYENQSPSDTAIKSLEAILAYEAYQSNIDPDGMGYHSSSQLTLNNISTHRDGNSAIAPGACPKGTVCPGDSLYVLMPQIRQNVDSKSCMQGVDLDVLTIEDRGTYPNPAKDKVSIYLRADDQVLGVFDYMGRGMDVSWQKQGHRCVLDVSSIAAGLYSIHIYGDRLYTLNLLKN